MTACNATMAERTCSVDIKYHDHAFTGEGLKRLHDDGGVTWTDDAPGATPHEDPTPTYRVDRDAEHWIVTSGDNRIAGMVAWFDGGGDHPDPEGAADAEARRLRCQPHDGDESLHGAWVCDGCRVEVSRDPSIISAAELDRDEARAEADCYRKALEQIAEPAYLSDVANQLHVKDIARRVLNGGQP